MSDTHSPQCEDCGLLYSDPRFQDFVIPDKVFCRISSTGDENGLFCPNCLLGRLVRAGIECVGEFTSGPILKGGLP